jgi:hypothetical protein
MMIALSAEHGLTDYSAFATSLRGGAMVLLRQHDSNAPEAQRCFQRAIEIARNQSAKSWELRATMSLARLLRDTGRRDEARTVLADIYGWFTEGYSVSSTIRRAASRNSRPTIVGCVPPLVRSERIAPNLTSSTACG